MTVSCGAETRFHISCTHGQKRIEQNLMSSSAGRGGDGGLHLGCLLRVRLPASPRGSPPPRRLEGHGMAYPLRPPLPGRPPGAPPDFSHDLRPAMWDCRTGKWRRRRRGSTWILCPEADSMASTALPCTPSPTARPFPYSASTDIETQQHGSRRPQSPGIEPIPLGTRN
jgi:hypothetical protein